MIQQLDVIELEELDCVTGGLKLGGALGLATAAAPIGATSPMLTTPGLPQPFVGVPGAFYPEYGGMFDHEDAREAFREFVHDPTFSSALSTFAAQHPEFAGVLAQDGYHQGIRHLMHDPNGRVALDRFFHDPTFATAYQQFSAMNPDLAAPIAQMVQRLEHRMHTGAQYGYAPFAPFGTTTPFVTPGTTPTFKF